MSRTRKRFYKGRHARRIRARYSKPWSVQYEFGPRPSMVVEDSVRLPIGPGGAQCSCCFPPPGSDARRKEFKRARRKAAKLAFELEELHMEGGDDEVSGV